MPEDAQSTMWLPVHVPETLPGDNVASGTGAGERPEHNVASGTRAGGLPRGGGRLRIVSQRA